MIRSMMLVLAIGAAGAAGCVAQDEATGTTSQNTGNDGLFDCQNNHSISGVQCVGDISILNDLSVEVKDVLNGNTVDVLSGNQISILNNDLNNLSVLDGGINIANYSTILNDVQALVLSDFLNKFDIDTDVNHIDVCAVVGFLHVCQ